MDIKQAKKFKREDLAKSFGEWGLNKGYEIGVCWGGYSKELCEGNPNLTLKSVDPYKLVYGDDWTEKIGEEQLDGLFEEATELLSPFNCEILRKTSLEAVAEVENESLDFVYIDGSHHFDYVMADIIEWGKRVRKGGIISGHDYCESWPEVMRAVNNYAEVHGAVINITSNRTPSWWIEKTW